MLLGCMSTSSKDSRGGEGEGVGEVEIEGGRKGERGERGV